MRVMWELEQVSGLLRHNAGEEHLLNDHDQNPPDEDFATMFAASIKGQTKRLAPGQAIGHDCRHRRQVAFVNVGGKAATIALDELRDDDGAPKPACDRTGHAREHAGGLTLSRKLQRGDRPTDRGRARSGPRRGQRRARRQGGFEVSIAKSVRSAPRDHTVPRRSRCARRRVHVPLLEYADNGRKLSSRRAVLEAEQQPRLRRTAHVPARPDGGGLVRDFGRSSTRRRRSPPCLEMDWARVTGGGVSPGQDVSVKVARGRRDGQIALGLKQLTADPWAPPGGRSAIVPARSSPARSSVMPSSAVRDGRAGSPVVPSRRRALARPDLPKPSPSAADHVVVLGRCRGGVIRLITAVARRRNRGGARRQERESGAQAQSLGRSPTSCAARSDHERINAHDGALVDCRGVRDGSDRGARRLEADACDALGARFVARRPRRPPARSGHADGRAPPRSKSRPCRNSLDRSCRRRTRAVRKRFRAL